MIWWLLTISNWLKIVLEEAPTLMSSRGLRISSGHDHLGTCNYTQAMLIFCSDERLEVQDNSSVGSCK